MKIDLLFYGDKYVSGMPVEEKRITMELKDSDAKGERPNVEISGFKL